MLKIEVVNTLEDEAKMGVLTSYYGASMVLKDEQGEVVSGKYIGMMDLGDDHYAVSIIESHLNYLGTLSVEMLDNADYEIIDDIKWAIIRLTRDKDGNVIPYGEVFVTPYVYNYIRPNNLKTATVARRGLYTDRLYTYVDLDTTRDTYGKELVPCMLDKAECFSAKYEGFAECEFKNISGYLPREKTAASILEPFEILEEEQAAKIAKMSLEDRKLYFDALEFNYRISRGLAIKK